MTIINLNSSFAASSQCCLHLELKEVKEDPKLQSFFKKCCLYLSETSLETMQLGPCAYHPEEKQKVFPMNVCVHKYILTYISSFFSATSWLLKNNFLRILSVNLCKGLFNSWLYKGKQTFCLYPRKELQQTLSFKSWQRDVAEGPSSFVEANMLLSNTDWSPAGKQVIPL